MDVILSNTKDHSLFELYEDNRVITEQSIQKMIKTLEHKNLLSCFPLVVYKDKGQMYITDGQRRSLAAKRLGLTVYYIINNKCTKDDIPRINTGQVPWKMENYLHSFCIKAQYSKHGTHADYLRLEDFRQIYKFSIANCLTMLVGYDGTDINTNFKEGRFKIINYPKACEIAKNLTDFKPYHKEWDSKDFVRAITKLTRHAKYDHANMMKKMERHHEKLIRWSTSGQYVLNLQDIYNNRKQHKTVFVKV